MQIDTFVNTLTKCLGPTVLKGWRSGASFEVSVQTELSDLWIRHLQSNLAVTLDMAGKPVEHFQVEGRKAVMPDVNGQITISGEQKQLEQIDTTVKAKKMGIKVEREYDYEYVSTYNYSQSPKISDLFVTNKRWVQENNSLALKSAYFWVELKVESPKINKFQRGDPQRRPQFGGESAEMACRHDTWKLAEQKKHDDGKGLRGLVKRRYWWIVIACSPEGVAAVKKIANQSYHGAKTVVQDWAFNVDGRTKDWCIGSWELKV